MTLANLKREALAKAIRLLTEGQLALPDFRCYATAILFNQSLWNIIQCDLSSPDNPLPPELRNNLLQLSLFIDRQTTTRPRRPPTAIICKF